MTKESSADLLDIAGETFVEVLHVLLLPLARGLDGRNARLRHHGVGAGRRADVAKLARSLHAAARRAAGTRVRRAVDDQMARGHHRLVDGRRRRLGLVRRPRLVGGRLDARRRSFGRSLATDAYALRHVD